MQTNSVHHILWFSNAFTNHFMFDHCSILI